MFWNLTFIVYYCSQALRAVSHNYPNIMFACWERVSTIVYGFFMVATPEVPARPRKGNAGDIVGVIGEKFLTAAVKVGPLCMSIPLPTPPTPPIHPRVPKKKKNFVCLGKGKKRQIVLFLVPSIPSCMISTDSIILLLLLKFNMSFNNVYWSICFIFLVHFIRTSFDGLSIMRLMYLSDLGLWRTLTCFWRVLFYVLSRCLNLLNLGILVGWMQNS